jgi:hypothetical protein
MNWQPAEQTAVNPQTGERVALIGGQWVPVEQSAVNPQTGERLVMARSQPDAPRQPATLGQRLQTSLPGRIVQGMRDPLDGAAQLAPRALEFLSSAGGLAPNRVSEFFGSEAGRVDAMNAGNEQAYQGARAAVGQDGFDGGRLLGNIASPVNLLAAKAAPIRGGMSLKTIAGRGAVAGGVGGALQPLNDPAAQQDFAGEKTVQALLGAATGAAVSPAIVRGAEAVTRRIAAPSGGAAAVRAAQQVDDQVRQALREIGQDAASVPEDVLRSLRQQALTSLKQGKKLDVAAALRASDFEALGMQPLRGQVTRDPMQFARERNLRGIEGVGERITARLIEQRRTMGDTLRNFSGGASERADAGQRIVDALQATDEKMGKNVSALYNAARASSKADLDIPLQGLAQDVADVVDRFGDKVPSGVMNQVRSLGLLGGTQKRVFTLADADRVSKVINDNVGNDPATNAALTALRQSLKRAVESAVPNADNPFAPAVRAAAERFQLRDAIPALRVAAQGGANEDAFVRQFVLRSRPTEVRKLAELLAKESPDAFSQARQQMGAFLERSAFGTNLAGDRAFAPERFAASLDSLGTARLKAFFKPEEITQLRALARVGAYIGSEPTASAVNRSNTAGAGANILGRLLRGVPGVDAARAIGRSVAQPVINNNRLTQALSAQIPQTAADLTPEQARLLARIAGPLIVGSGVAGASPLVQ